MQFGEHKVPYNIVAPVDGQEASASLFGIPVRTAILDLDARVSQAEVEQQRVLARGRRTSDKTGIGTTELGVLRIDNIPVLSGYMYRISTSSINMDIDPNATPAGEIQTAVLRVAFSATTGTSATTASDEIGRIRLDIANQSQGPIANAQGFYFAASTGYISVLLSSVRQAGSNTLKIAASATVPLDLTVEYAGVDPGDTGVIL